MNTEKLSPSKLFLMQKKGASGTDGKIKGLIAALIFIVILVALAPTFFTGLGSSGSGIGNVTANPAVPTWLPTVLIIIVAAGLVYAAFKAFS